MRKSARYICAALLLAPAAATAQDWPAVKERLARLGAEPMTSRNSKRMFRKTSN